MPIAQGLALIAFLASGEVWTVSVVSGAPVQLTRTGGLLEDFRFSPNREYLAYAKRIRRSDERWVTSIVVVHVATASVLTEIVPQEGWIDIDRWLGTTLIYHASAALEVTGVYEYDAVRRTRREVDLASASMAFDRDVTTDGDLLA